jgi:hypothetical protein
MDQYLGGRRQNELGPGVGSGGTTPDAEYLDGENLDRKNWDEENSGEERWTFRQRGDQVWDGQGCWAEPGCGGQNWNGQARGSLRCGGWVGGRVRSRRRDEVIRAVAGLDD